MVDATEMQAPNHHYNWVQRCIARFKAKRQVRTIMRSLNEAEEIHAGKRAAISLEDFLKDF